MVESTELAPRDPDVRELRIALVCYGGVSLAIYMHGVVKELHALVRASRALDKAREEVAGGTAPVNPFDAKTRTEHAYFDELCRITGTGLPLSVTIDVISGTSAGGINGVCLAQGILHDASEDSLTSLWMNNGDLRKLLHFSWAGLRGGAFLTGLVLPWRIRSTKWAPLRGDNMCQWLYEALTDMELSNRPGSLLPEGGRLNLGVTATDLNGYDRVVPLANGQTMRDRSFRKVFRFRYQAGESNFAAGPMAFAARATSSFPGAFPPVSPNDFAAAATHFSAEAFAKDFLPEYSAEAAQGTRFADGGVLDNSPFDVAISVIAEQPAEREVLRHLVYIEPNPSRMPPADAAPSGPGEPLTLLDTVKSALLTVPRHQPLLGAMENMANFNVEAQTVGELANQLSAEVSGELAKIPGKPEDSAGFDEFHRWMIDVVTPYVRQVAGPLNYRSYCRLKLDEICQRLIGDLATFLRWPEKSPEASFLRAALGVWTTKRAEWSASNDEDFSKLTEFLSLADIPFRERRLMFILQGINALFSKNTDATLHGLTTADQPSRSDLATVKKAAWDILEHVQQMPDVALRTLPEDVLAVVQGPEFWKDVRTAEPAKWAADNADRITALAGAYRDAVGSLINGNSRELWEAFEKTTSSWGGQYRRAIVERYLAFPIWDAMIFPVIALSHLPQFSPIMVSRFNPEEAKAFGVENKLKGTGAHHFAAFFKEEWRENDYLWGRLDGTELVLKMLRSETPDGAVALGDPILDGALAAVLADEKPKLRNVKELISKREADLRR